VKDKEKLGRPTDYRPEYAKMAEVACKLGAIDKDLAELFGVCVATINNWKHDHPLFLESLKAKASADEQVEQALFKRAIGAKVTEERVIPVNGEAVTVESVKEYPPDTAACIIWLANRNPDRWKKDPTGDSNQGKDLAAAIEKLADRLPN
jgi:hypothetical protein